MGSSIAVDDGGRENMWLRRFGVLLATVLYTNGIAFGQDAAAASGGGFVTSGFDWLSPARLAWFPVNFNWSDLPIQIFARESGGYNSNIYNLSQSQLSLGRCTTLPFFGCLPPGQLRGDYFVRTNLGVSSKFYIENQQFFFDLTQTTTNYHHDTIDDIHNHSFDGGVNWKWGSHCDGKLMVVNALTQALQEEQLGPGIDNLTTQSFNESGQCHFYQNIDVILNANALSTRHSQFQSIPLNNNTNSFQSGLQYQWPSLDSVQALIKYSNTNYTNRTPLTTLITGAPQFVHMAYYTVVYTNQSSQIFNFSIMGGVSESLDLTSASGNRTNGPLSPVYSISLSYHPTSKWALTLSSSRTVAAPTSILTTSATQTSTAQAASFSYALTPKVNLSASLGMSTSTAPGRTAGGNFGNLYYGPSNVMNVTLGAAYTITPFTSLVLSLYQTKRQSTGTSALNGSGNVNSSIVTLGLDYRPR